MVLYVVSSADGRMVSRPSQETAARPPPPPFLPPLIFLQHRLHNMHSRGELGVSWMGGVMF